MSTKTKSLDLYQPIEFRAILKQNYLDFFKQKITDFGNLRKYPIFDAMILSKALPVSTLELTTLKKFILPKNLCDSQILAEIGGAAFFHADQLLAVIYCLVANQAWGKRGHLHTDGKANLFFAKDYVIDLRWKFATQTWEIDLYNIEDDGPWLQGAYVIYA